MVILLNKERDILLFLQMIIHGSQISICKDLQMKFSINLKNIGPFVEDQKEKKIKGLRSD